MFSFQVQDSFVFVQCVSGAGYFLVNCYRAREGNRREEERRILSFSPRVRARVLKISFFALKNRHLLATQAVKDVTC